MWTYDVSMPQKQTARSGHPCPFHEIRLNPVPFAPVPYYSVRRVY